MKISLQWLADYLPGPLSAENAAEALTQGGLPVESVETTGDDTVLDVEVTSNRGDCLSHLGIARELAALLNRPWRDVVPSAAESSTPVAQVTSVRIDAPQLCPQYIARVLRNVKIGDSPPWLSKRLQSVGLRPINNVVDVTNYVMFELGQPLHAFDLDKLEGHRIIVRQAASGEKIVSIDGRERTLSSQMLVIADAARPVAIAGVMGGRDTEVSPSTRNVLLESARFDPLSVRKTARELAMKSDSSYRFERGIDPLLAQRASLRAAELILQMAGGELLASAATAGTTDAGPKRLSLRLKTLQRVLGISLPVPQILDALKRLNLSPTLAGDQIDVLVPSYRLDLNIEVDLVEEVARVIGYDQVPVRDEISIRLAPPDPASDVLETIRSVLTSAGYFEAITFGWVSDLLAADFVPAQAIGLARVDASVRKADACLRPSILPGLLESMVRNENVGVGNPRLFEIGSTFWLAAGGALEERRRIAWVANADLRDVRGVLEVLLSRINSQLPLQVIPQAQIGFAPSAGGRVEWAGQVLGHFGQLDPAIAQKLGLRQVPVGAEIDLLPLLEAARRVVQQQPLPTFPAVRRDLSLVVPRNTRYQQIESVIRACDPPWLEGLEYVTIYCGKPLPPDAKSVTVTLIFRSPGNTLTAQEVEAAMVSVISAAKSQLGATLRE